MLSRFIHPLFEFFLKIMTTRLQETIEVPRSIDDVFRYVSDFSTVEQWDPGVAYSDKVSAGPLGVGSAFKVWVKLGLQRLPMAYVITAYEPPRRVVLEGRGDGIQAIDTIEFTETDQGTRIDYTADLTFGGLLGMVQPLMGGALDRVGKNAMAGLHKALAEVPPPPQGSLVNDIKDRLVFPGMLCFTNLGYRWHKSSWQPLSASLQGQTAIVTGATSGLGRAAAKRLIKLGARVVLVGRNAKKTEAVQQELISATGSIDIAIEVADLSLMAEVERLAQRLLKQEPRIQILVNNAGVLLNERTVTDEGIETSLATNLLAPFLLTNRLLPRLRESAPARIINVSSGGMYTAGIVVDDLQYEKGTYDGSKAYARQKRGLVILTERWAEQLQDTGVVVNAMHPGWADTPGVETSLPAFYKFTKRWLRTPEEGADTIVWLAAAPEAGEVSGQFWLDREPHITHILPGTRASEQERKQLWDALAELSGWQQDKRVAA